ncbi:MAG: hypothetical protein KKG60_00610 [Nanoarchaeota archaeon]|nr:hypothetical protein [Nanoarchaeota archaeon]
MKKEDLDQHFIDSVKKAVDITMENIKKLNDFAFDSMEIGMPKGARSTIFHDGILQQLKKFDKFDKAKDNISDFSYEGERWELKTNRTKQGISVNKVNLLEKVKILMVNALPEDKQLFQIRVLDSRDRYFNPAKEGTQIRSLNKEGQEKAIVIHS